MLEVTIVTFIPMLGETCRHSSCNGCLGSLSPLSDGIWKKFKSALRWNLEEKLISRELKKRGKKFEEGNKKGADISSHFSTKGKNTIQGKNNNEACNLQALQTNLSCICDTFLANK